MSIRLFCICFLFSHLFSGAIFCPSLQAAVNENDIAKALDFPEGVTFSVLPNQDWFLRTKITVDIDDPKKIPTHKGTYLEGKAADKNDPQKQISFSLTVRGAGELSFFYQVSLENGNWMDDSKNSYLCAYEGAFDFDDILFSDSGFWSKDDYDDGDDYGWWWSEASIFLGEERYTHIVTFTLFSPAKTDYEAPDTSGGSPLKKVWLDQFVWEPDDKPILAFSPDQKEFNTFKDFAQIFIEYNYENLQFSYTTDGTTPTKDSQLYNNVDGINITKTTTIKAIALENGIPINGEVFTATYLRKTQQPEPLLIQEDDLTSNPTLKFQSEPGAVVYYTLNGQNPVRNSDNTAGENTFISPQTLDGPVTALAMAWKEGQADSDVFVFTVEKLEPPEISFSLYDNSSQPSFNNNGTLTLTAPQDAIIKYQINSGNTTLEYANPLRINQTTEIRFQAQQAGKLHSDVVLQTFEKLSAPQISYLLDGDSSHPYFDDASQLILNASAPAGSTIIYQIDEGDIRVFEDQLDLNITQTTEIRFQAQQTGKLHSDTITRKFYRADTQFTLPAPSPGWSLFFLPGEVREQTSNELIAQWKPIAYDHQKKIYFRPDLLLGGNSYWIFTSEGSTRSDTSFFIFPLEGITVPSKTWLLSGILNENQIPEGLQAHKWNGQIFQPVSAPPTGAAWLYKP